MDIMDYAKVLLKNYNTGIYNYNYSVQYPPILNNTLEVCLNYQKSEKSYLIQASDLVAGTIRRTYLQNIGDIAEFSKRTQFIDYILFLP